MFCKIRNLRLNKLLYAIFFFGLLAIGVARFNSYASEVSVTWNNLNLTTDGDYSWSCSYSGGLVVDKYEIKLARKNNGSWNESYKTYKTSDNSYSCSFSSTGQYYFKVRAIFVGGDKSNWSGQSNTVSVSSSDISDNPGSGSSSGPVYVQTTINGTTYYVPAGPGTTGTTTTTTGPSVIGPDGQYRKGGNTGTVNYTSAGGATLSGTAVNSGWIKDGTKWRYRYANNTYANNTMDRINDKWYYFDANGYMVTGWVYYNANWYLFGLDGHMLTGWNMVNNKWYYMNGSGIMQTGYIEVDGIKYYCDQSGARVQSGYNPDGHYFDESGVMIK